LSRSGTRLTLLRTDTGFARGPRQGPRPAARAGGKFELPTHDIKERNVMVFDDHCCIVSDPGHEVRGLLTQLGARQG